MSKNKIPVGLLFNSRLKIIVLIIVIFTTLSCAYKPRLLSFSGGGKLEKSCLLLGGGVSNRQSIYYTIKDQFANYPGEKDLRYFYDLDQFIPLFNNECRKTSWRIEKISTEILFFSSSGKIKDGIKLEVEVAYIKNGETIKNEIFYVTKIGQFYSGFTATKKKVDKSMTILLEIAFLEFKKQLFNGTTGF